MSVSMEVQKKAFFRLPNYCSVLRRSLADEQIRSGRELDEDEWWQLDVTDGDIACDEILKTLAASTISTAGDVISFIEYALERQQDPPNVSTAALEAAAELPRHVRPSYLQSCAQQEQDEGKDLDFLRRFLETVDSRRLRSVLKDIVAAALSIEEHFPLGVLELEEMTGATDGGPLSLVERWSLSRPQAKALLAHLFLCTLRRQEPTGTKYWVTLQPWFEASASASCASYLSTLLEYFESSHLEGEGGTPADGITFSKFRCDLSTADILQRFDRPEARAPEEVVKLSVRCEDAANSRLGGCIAGFEDRFLREELGGQVSLHAEVDFAHRFPGFGRSASQEELLFGHSPELCLVVLMTSAEGMADSEVITAAGVLRAGCYRQKASSQDVEFTGPHAEIRQRAAAGESGQRLVIMMDATERDVKRKDTAEMLERDLRKAFLGFLCAVSHITRSAEGSTVLIDTGKWGCGAFGGRVEKLIPLQAAAARMAVAATVHGVGDEHRGQVLLRYFVCGDRDAAEIVRAISPRAIDWQSIVEVS